MEPTKTLTELENEVIELGARIERDRARLREIIDDVSPREVVASEDSRPAARAGRGGRKGGRVVRGRRKTVKQVLARVGGGSAESAGRVTYHPEMIVECSLCGARVGTRRQGSVPYPYRHEGPDGRPCKGAKQPAKLVVEEG